MASQPTFSASALPFSVLAVASKPFLEVSRLVASCSKAASSGFGVFKFTGQVRRTFARSPSGL